MSMKDEFDFDQYYEQINGADRKTAPGGSSAGAPPPGGFRPQNLSVSSFRGESRHSNRTSPVHSTTDRLRERNRQAQPLFGQGYRRFRPSFLDSLPNLWGVDLALGIPTLIAIICIIVQWESVSMNIVCNILQILSSVLVILVIALVIIYLFRSVFRGRFF